VGALMYFQFGFFNYPSELETGAMLGTFRDVVSLFDETLDGDSDKLLNFFFEA
jgi:hypothetical protein